MSDLAPFVAAVLKDKVLAELLEEKKRSEYIEITGPNHQPVYARGHISDGSRRVEGRVEGRAEQSNWVVHFTEVRPCLLSNLESIELWMRNYRVGEFPLVKVETRWRTPPILDVDIFDQIGPTNPAWAIKMNIPLKGTNPPNCLRFITQNMSQADPSKAAKFQYVIVRGDRFLGL